MHKLDGLDTLTQPHTKTHPLLSEQEPMNRRELLPIIRKLVLCIGVFISLLLVLYPPWRVSLKLGGEFSAGRSFIGYHPLLTGKQLDTLLCPLMDEVVPYTSGEHHPPYVLKPYIELYADLLSTAEYRIHRGRQIIDPLLCLGFTFALCWALKPLTHKREAE